MVMLSRISQRTSCRALGLGSVLGGCRLVDCACDREADSEDDDQDNTDSKTEYNSHVFTLLLFRADDCDGTTLLLVVTAAAGVPLRGNGVVDAVTGYLRCQLDTTNQRPDDREHSEDGSTVHFVSHFPIC